MSEPWDFLRTARLDLESPSAQETHWTINERGKSLYPPLVELYPPNGFGAQQIVLPLGEPSLLPQIPFGNCTLHCYR